MCLLWHLHRILDLAQHYRMTQRLLHTLSGHHNLARSSDTCCEETAEQHISTLQMKGFGLMPW